MNSTGRYVRSGRDLLLVRHQASDHRESHLWQILNVKIRSDKKVKLGLKEVPTINSTRSPRDLGALHFLKKTLGNVIRISEELNYLNSCNTAEGPEVAVTDPGEFLLHLLQEAPSNIQTVVSLVQSFGFKTHRRVVAASYQK